MMRDDVGQANLIHHEALNSKIKLVDFSMS